MSKDEKASDKDDFTFIKEQIVPKKKSKLKKFIISLGSTACFAILFGVIARVAFIVSEPFVNHLFGYEGEKQQELYPLNSGESNMQGNLNSKEQQKNGGISAGSTGSNTMSGDEGGISKGEGKEDPITSDVEETKSQIVNHTYIVEKKIKPTLKDLVTMMEEVKKVASEASNSLVTVNCIKSGVDWLKNQYDVENETSGLIVGNDGTKLMILTSYSEVKDTSTLKVSFLGSRDYKAKLQAYDKETNLAVICVNLKNIELSVLDQIKVAHWGESYSISNGAPVIAVGAPNGMIGSMDFGIVTSRTGVAYITDHKLDLFHTNLIVSEKGSGFIINMDGDVVGIITHKFSEDNEKEMNTVIGISRVKKSIIDNLVKLEDRIYFGVVAADMPAEKMKVAEVTNGIYVNEVKTNSPAYEAGIQNGDIIISMNDLAVGGMNSFMNILANCEIKDMVTVRVKRFSDETGKEIELEVQLDKK